VIVPPQILDQWRRVLQPVAKTLVLETVRNLRHLGSVETLAGYRFVLVNATFLSSNNGAFQSTWEVLRCTLLSVRFRLRIVDEFTDYSRVDAPQFHGDRIGVSRGVGILLLETVFMASATLLVSADPFPPRSGWPHLLCMALLLGVEYDGRPLFGRVDECAVTRSLSVEKGVIHRGRLAFEDRRVVGRVLLGMRQPYFQTPRVCHRGSGVHMVHVPESAVSELCAVYGHPVSVRGVLLSRERGYEMPSASVFRAAYLNADDTRYRTLRRRQRREELMAAGHLDICCYPAATRRPALVTLLRTGSSTLALPCPSWTPSCVGDVWVAVHGILTAQSEARALLFVHEHHLAMAQRMLSVLELDVLVLDGNSAVIASRIRQFTGGTHSVMVVPSTRCSGIDLPEVTHIIVPYRPSTCRIADIRQLVARVQRRGTSLGTCVVFVATMSRVDEEPSARAVAECIAVQ
jgi:hypothetical protein